jgi:hypothetical protein
MAKSKAKALANSPTLMPIDVEVELILFEKNLLNVGLFAASDPRNKVETHRRIEKEVIRNGHNVKVAAVFRCPPEYGLPTTSDRDKTIAFLRIINEDRARNGVLANPFRFSGYRMIQELGLTRNAGIYEDILRWGQRMANTTITSEQVVFLASKKVFSNDTLHVFEKFRRYGTSDLDDSNKQLGFEVVLADWFLENLNQRFVVPQDFSAYKKLGRPISKGIFGYLHLAFHASCGRPVEKNYADLCSELGIATYTAISKIKSTLAASLDELVSIQYLSKWAINPLIGKRGYKIVFTAGPELMKFLSKNRSDRQLPSDAGTGAGPTILRPLGDSDMTAVKALLDHGVTPDKAVSLVQIYGSQRVSDVVDYQESQINAKNSRVQNPAGLIIYSLESNLPIPARFVTSRIRKEIDERTNAEREGLQRESSLRVSYEEWKDERLSRAFEEKYPPSVLPATLATIIAKRKEDDIFKRVNHQQRLDLATQLIKKEIRDELNFPSFEDWSAGQTQANLFG